MSAGDSRRLICQACGVGPPAETQLVLLLPGQRPLVDPLQGADQLLQEVVTVRAAAEKVHLRQSR